MPPFYFLTGLVLIVALALWFPLLEILAWPWRGIGLLPIAIGIWFNLAADRQFKARGTTIKPFQRSTALVTDGVFAVSRNPIYLGMVLILIGAALLSGALAPFLVCFGFAALIHFRFILAEERMLTEIFGESYRAYCAMTRRWI